MHRVVRRELAGVLAGAAGTLAMDAFRFRGERRQGSAGGWRRRPCGATTGAGLAGLTGSAGLARRAGLRGPQAG